MAQGTFIIAGRIEANRQSAVSRGIVRLQLVPSPKVLDGFGDITYGQDRRYPQDGHLHNLPRTPDPSVNRVRAPCGRGFLALGSRLAVDAGSGA